MTREFADDKPIFVQIAERIEDCVLSGAFPEESQIPSTTEIAVSDKINPATALKGINLLVEEGIVYKRRGLGMFVSTGAVRKVKDKRKEQFYDRYIIGLAEEAKKLSLTKEEVMALIERGYQG